MIQFKKDEPLVKSELRVKKDEPIANKRWTLYTLCWVYSFQLK